MNDFMDSEPTPRRFHRCDLKRSRRGKPRLGERASCECGAEFMYVDTRFGRDWSPITATVR